MFSVLPRLNHLHLHRPLHHLHHHLPRINHLHLHRQGLPPPLHQCPPPLPHPPHLHHFLHHVFHSQSSVFSHQRHRPLRSFFGSSAEGASAAMSFLTSASDILLGDIRIFLMSYLN